MFVTANSDCVEATEAQGVALLASWLGAAGLPPDAWPLDTDDVGEVLTMAGYACDADELRRLGDLGQVPSLGSWDAKDVLAAAGSLEARRQWRHPSVHSPKIYPQVQLLEEFLAQGDAGVEMLSEQFKKFDLRLALILLAEAPNRELRERMLATTYAVLATQHGIRP